jgi:hypothetical protein
MTVKTKTIRIVEAQALEGDGDFERIRSVLDTLGAL